MAATTIDIGTLITFTPGLHGSAPHIFALREAIQCGELKSGQPLPQEEFAIICLRGVPDSISRDRWDV